MELKFSRLILQRSAIAVSVESIIRSAFSLDINFRNIFLVKDGKRILRLADIMLLVELTFRPINSVIKYLKRNACNIILPITDATEIINGTRPTANISLGET